MAYTNSGSGTRLSLSFRGSRHARGRSGSRLRGFGVAEACWCALASEGQISIGAKPVPPGTELGMLYVFAVGQTRNPLTFKSVTVPGQGIGTVVQVVEIRMAHYRRARQRDPAQYGRSLPARIQPASR
jgi:hypothetical protein